MVSPSLPSTVFLDQYTGEAGEKNRQKIIDSIHNGGAINNNQSLTDAVHDMYVDMLKSLPDALKKMPEQISDGIGGYWDDPVSIITDSMEGSYELFAGLLRTARITNSNDSMQIQINLDNFDKSTLQEFGFNYQDIENLGKIDIDMSRGIPGTVYHFA